MVLTGLENGKGGAREDMVPYSDLVRMRDKFKRRKAKLKDQYKFLKKLRMMQLRGEPIEHLRNKYISYNQLNDTGEKVPPTHPNSIERPNTRKCTRKNKKEEL